MDPKFIKDLKQLRLEKKISLQDISGATRINVRFLEAIERGDFDILPKPYIRSFIKQYAKYIGFDENRVIAQFEEYNRNVHQNGNDTTADSEKTKPALDPVNDPKLKTVFLSLAVIGGIALVVYLVITIFSTTEEPVAERPFQDVVREIEEQAEQTTIEPLDSPATAQPEQEDSVSLAVTAIDSVWLTITVDNVLQQEYIFPPGRSREWKAANEFLLTVGNAGGVSIAVNDDSIGVLGSPGQVLRNLLITRDGIRR